MKSAPLKSWIGNTRFHLISEVCHIPTPLISRTSKSLLSRLPIKKISYSEASYLMKQLRSQETQAATDKRKNSSCSLFEGTAGRGSVNKSALTQKIKATQKHPLRLILITATRYWYSPNLVWELCSLPHTQHNNVIFLLMQTQAIQGNSNNRCCLFHRLNARTCS